MKVKKFIITDALVLQVLTTGFHMPKFTIEQGIPEGAQIFDVERVGSSTVVHVLHESFDPIALKEPVPTFDIIVTITPPVGAAS